MSEENNSRDDLVNHTDSNRQIVSRNLDTFSDDVVLAAHNGSKSYCNRTINVLPVGKAPHSLNHGLKKLKAQKFTISDVEKMTSDFANLINNDIVVRPLLKPVTLVQPCREASHASLVSNGTVEPQLDRKRKRDSPEENSMRIRLQLQKYAYKSAYSRSKNVSFQLQADPIASHSESSVGSSDSERNVTMVENTNPIITRPNTLPRSSEPYVITQEDARNYEVPYNKLHIWKLLEAQLRKVGRHDARVSQMSEDLEADRPPSWCFGGTTAPSYLRPFDDILINITRAYANTMGAAARQIMYQTAQDDQREADSLLETLRRMYESDKDPNFELAHQRALGIATHYKEKEVDLNNRLHQADIPNQPQTRAEWSESLGRRKVSKPGRNRSSRSRSPANGQRNGPNNRPQTNQQPQRRNQPQPTQNNNQRQQTQPRQQQPKHNPRQDNRYNAKNNNNQRQNNYNNRSNTRNMEPQPSGSNTNQQSSSRNNQAPRQGHQTPRTHQLDLNAEEQALINMMRAAKNQNNQ